MVLLSVLLVTTFLSLTGAQRMTVNGRCGASYGLTCTGSAFGECCSQAGFCGFSPDYCGQGCQPSWGTCAVAAATAPNGQPISTDGRCGDDYDGQTCIGYGTRNCCSIYGYCGDKGAYCRPDNCQPDYGVCGLFNERSSAAPSSTNLGACASSILTVTSIIRSGVSTLIQEVTASAITVTVVRPAVTQSLFITATPSPLPAITVTSLQSAPALTITATISVTTTTIQLRTISQIITSILPTGNPALLNVDLGLNLGASATSSAYICPTDTPLQNGGFESPTLAPWIPLSAGVSTSNRTTTGTLSAAAYKFSIDGANPSLPQRLMQAVSLCPNATYALAFSARRPSAGTGTIGLTGSLQAGNGSTVPLAGGEFGVSPAFLDAARLGTVTVPPGNVAVPGVLVLEANFPAVGLTGVKEVLVDDVVLSRVG